MECFPNITGMVLDKYISDHRSILLVEHRVDYGPTLFRVFHSWFRLDGFDEIVRQSWPIGIEGDRVDNPWVIF